MTTSAAMTTLSRQSGGVTKQLTTSLRVLRNLEPAGWQQPTKPGRKIGAELEVDAPKPINGPPVACNPLEIEDARIGCELGLANGEFGLTPVLLCGRPFTALADEFAELVALARPHVQKNGGTIVCIGTPPTLCPEDTSEETANTGGRYRRINDEVGARGSRFKRRHPWVSLFPEACAGSIWPEMAATAMQPNIDTSPSEFPALYDAARIAAAVLLAITANDPLPWGKLRWVNGRPIAAGRIPIFELTTRGRAFFSTGATPADFATIFERGAQHWPIILPTGDPGEDEDELAAVRRHNGTIWEWDRGKLGFDQKTGQHVAILENRSASMPATISDAMAALAFHTGLIFHIAGNIDHWRKLIPCGVAHDNFYAALHGLDAELRWPVKPGSGRLRKIRVPRLVLDLLPDVEATLRQLGVEGGEAAHFLGIIEETMRREMNGAAWQLNAYRQLELATGDQNTALRETMRLYIEQSQEGLGGPVHTWRLPI